MNLSSLRSNTKRKTPKRRGRGSGSGLGKTSGRGHKGAGQRSGKKLPYVGFSGGNIPYIRKIPKRGFNHKKDIVYQIVNLKDINEKLKDIKEIKPINLKEANLIKDQDKPVKILAKLDNNKEFNLNVSIYAHKFSNKAKELIEKFGGKAVCIEY